MSIIAAVKRHLKAAGLGLILGLCAVDAMLFGALVHSECYTPLEPLVITEVVEVLVESPVRPMQYERVMHYFVLTDGSVVPTETPDERPANAEYGLTMHVHSGSGELAQFWFLPSCHPDGRMYILELHVPVDGYKIDIVRFSNPVLPPAEAADDGDGF